MKATCSLDSDFEHIFNRTLIGELHTITHAFKIRQLQTYNLQIRLKAQHHGVAISQHHYDCTCAIINHKAHLGGNFELTL